MSSSTVPFLERSIKHLGEIAIAAFIMGAIVSAIITYAINPFLGLYSSNTKNPISNSDIAGFGLYSVVFITIIFAIAGVIVENAKSDAPQYALMALMALIGSMFLVFIPQFFGLRTKFISGTDPSQQSGGEFFVESIFLLSIYWVVIFAGILGMSMVVKAVVKKNVFGGTTQPNDIKAILATGGPAPTQPVAPVVIDTTATATQ